MTEPEGLITDEMLEKAERAFYDCDQGDADFDSRRALRRSLEAAAGFIIAAHEARQWQPIRDEHKDGKERWLRWGPDDDPTTGVGRWNGGRWIACGSFYKGTRDRLISIEYRECYPDPTHARDLPLPPSDGGERT